MDRDKRNNIDNNELSKELSEYLSKTHPLRNTQEEERPPERHRTTEQKEVEAGDTKPVNPVERQAHRSNNEAKSPEDTNSSEKAIKDILASLKNSGEEYAAYAAAKKEPERQNEQAEVKREVRYENNQEQPEIDIPDLKRKSREAEAQQNAAEARRAQQEYDDDDDYELVQVARHKDKKLGKTYSKRKAVEPVEDYLGKDAEENEKSFSNIEAPDDFDELSDSLERKRVKRPTRSNTYSKKKKHSTEEGKFGSLERGLALNRFFGNDKFEGVEEDGGRIEKIIRYLMCGIVVCVFIIAVFIGVTVKLTGDLRVAEDEIEALGNLHDENEALKMDKESLQETIKTYEKAIAANGENGDGTTEENTDGNADGTDTNGTTGNSTQTGTTTNSGEYDTYTVVAGDTFSGISTKVYGTYSGYKKIMEANGIVNEGDLQVGQKLKIPKE